MLSNDVKKSAEIVDDVKTLKSSFTSLSSIVAENTQNIEKLISFCQELQKDGYLTLAEIKKAASSAFPVSS